MLWPAIKATCFKVKTKFACDNDFAADRRERFSDKIFVCKRAVDFGCIKERDAFFMSGTNDVDALVSVCGRSVVGAVAGGPNPLESGGEKCGAIP